MPLSDVTTGFGSELYINTGSGLVKVAEVDGIPELPTGSSRELYNTSSFDTAEYEEWKKYPLKDGVPITITGNYVINSASDDLLQAAEDADDALPYKIVLPEGDLSYEVTGNALFYDFKRMNPGKEKRTFSITLKPVDAASIDAV